MKKLIYAFVPSIITLSIIVFGGPGHPLPMSSLNDPFKTIHYDDIPKPSYFVARDGIKLAFNAYPAAGILRGSVVLVHGSSGKASGMHVVAKTLAAAGYAAYALDIRGHGNSGINKGQIAYVGQLEDDLEDFINKVKPLQPLTLIGFSSGGGFVLRFAGSERQKFFSNYLLLSPFVSPDAPTYRPNSGGWVSVGVPRWIAIGVLNSVGIRIFNQLPVIRFGLDAKDQARLTSEYSYSLAENFGAERDYRKNIRAIRQPMMVLAGADDEALYAKKFATVFTHENSRIPVTLIPSMGHIALILDPVAIQAEVSAVTHMNEQSVQARLK